MDEKTELESKYGCIQGESERLNEENRNIIKSYTDLEQINTELEKTNKNILQSETRLKNILVNQLSNIT